MKNNSKSIIMLGASGAVGTSALNTLLLHDNIRQLTLLGRNKIVDIQAEFVKQHQISIFEPETYQHFLPNHDVAICTLGVGEPSKISKKEFIKIDKTAVLDFATACKANGIKHFELLASVGINDKSSSFYLRTKGELVEALKTLNFERLSIFEPSMILTPVNRYGVAQAITLKVWPKLNFVFGGKLKKYRGIPVETLGTAMAKNVFLDKTGYEALQWEDFNALTEVK